MAELTWPPCLSPTCSPYSLHFLRCRWWLNLRAAPATSAVATGRARVTVSKLKATSNCRNER
eukprot:3645169-Rhodomonas_salina.1